MEKDRKKRELLGMKQEDMAMLLQVTLSQWSIYEIGKRDLTFVAQLKLVEMLAFLQQSDEELVDDFPHIKMQQTKMKKVFEDQKLINKHRLILTKRKLELIEKKYEAAMIGLNFVRFLETKEEQNLLLIVLKSRAEAEIQKNGLHVQAEYQLKLQALQQE